MAALDWVSREDGASGVTALGPEKTWLNQVSSRTTPAAPHESLSATDDSSLRVRTLSGPYLSGPAPTSPSATLRTDRFVL